MDNPNPAPPDSQDFVSPEFRALFPPDELGFNWLDKVPLKFESPLLIFQKAEVPGKPQRLLPEHFDAFQFVVNGSFNPRSAIKTWPDIVHNLQAAEQKQHDANNFCMPKWLGKTDDRVPTFAYDMGNVTTRTRQKFDEEMRRITEAICKVTAPADINAMGVILEPILKCLDLIAVPVGRTAAPKEPQDQWRWMRAVAILAGLGHDGVRIVAEELAEKSNQGVWAEYGAMTDEELDKLFHDAWLTSGYPLTTLWMDFVWFYNLLKEENERKALERIPFIFTPLLLTHVFKHVRLRRSGDGRWYIYMAYRGRQQRVYISNDGIHQSLSETTNQRVAMALDTVLRLDRGVGVRGRSPLQNATRAVLKEITPAMLAQPIDIATRPEVITGAAVSTPRAREDEQFHWIDPGIVISDIAVVNSNGTVNKAAIVAGADVLTYAWPDGEYDYAELQNWLAELPNEVQAERPGILIMKLIKNINPLGHPAAVAALFDAIVYGRLLRDDLTGSDLAGALRSERPIVPILADDASNMDLTTNIGKTTLAKLIAAINTPTVKTMAGSAITGGPCQREHVQPIRDDGTMILDDWKMPPPNRGYFSDQDSLQALSCGNMCAIGRAGENGTGVRLDQALYTTGKYLKAPPDIHTRTFKMFMTVLTEATRNTDAELVAVTTGRASKLIRIAALLYAQQHSLVETFRALAPVSSEVWRFFGHATIAAHFLGGETTEISAYLAEATEHAKAQCAAAHDAGVDEEIGDSDLGFDPRWHYDNASEEVMLDLAIRSMTDELLAPRLVLEALVRNAVKYGSCSYGKDPDRIMRNESSAVKKFTNLFKQNGLKLIHPGGWVMELVPKAKSERMVNSNPVAYIKAYHPDRKIASPKPATLSDNIIPFPTPNQEKKDNTGGLGGAQA